MSGSAVDFAVPLHPVTGHFARLIHADQVTRQPARSLAIATGRRHFRVVARCDGTSASTVRPPLLPRLVGSHAGHSCRVDVRSLSLSAICMMEALVVGGIVAARWRRRCNSRRIDRFAPCASPGSHARFRPPTADHEAGLMVNIRCMSTRSSAPAIGCSARDPLTLFSRCVDESARPLGRVGTPPAVPAADTRLRTHP
jgi:hypothetical protein